MSLPDTERWALQAAGIERSVGLFRLADRGLVEVSGADRVRWLDGMLTNDVAGLSVDSGRTGCYAALLTHQGRIVADIHVGLRENAFWLQMAAEAVPAVIERFDKHIIADAVTITDISSTTEWVGVEGPNATALIDSLAGRELALEPDCWTEIRVQECPVTVARWGTAIGPGYRLLVASGRMDPIVAQLCLHGAEYGLEEAGPEVLEILRIVAGTPRYGAELDESVLPAEAGLDERAISQTKGCYIGQEVVARMAARGKSSHRLVGLRFEGASAEVGATLRLDSSSDSKKIGEITSVCKSASHGHIALAFVRSAHAVVDQIIYSGENQALISNLPFGPVPQR